MTRRVVTTTAAADADVRDIASYIALDNPQIALEFEREFLNALTRIGEAANIGHSLHDLAPGFLVARVSRRFRRYLIFYRLPDDTAIEVVRVIHGARDVALLFAKSK